MTYRTAVKKINERTITFPYKSRVRGRVRITGTNTRTIHDGYQAQCSCGWMGTQTQYLLTATAESAGHADSHA
jgi:hypothetical protein